MSDLIDRQTAIEYIEAYIEKYEGIDEPFEDGVVYGINLSAGALSGVPSVTKAHWYRIGWIEKGTGIEGIRHKCSNCGYVNEMVRIPMTCPNCSACMCEGM